MPPLVHVPFAGAAPLIPQLLGGNMDLAALNVNDALQLKREGRVRILAQAAARRQPEAADVPTFRELGIDIVRRRVRAASSARRACPRRSWRGWKRPSAPRSNDEGFRREAERQNMPLRPLFGAEYKAFAQSIDDSLKRLWQVRPWRG